MLPAFFRFGEQCINNMRRSYHYASNALRRELSQQNGIHGDDSGNLRTQNKQASKSLRIPKDYNLF